jgi:hypothetical protein
MIFNTVGGVAPARVDIARELLPFARKNPVTGILCASIKDIRALSKANQGRLVEYGILSQHYLRL